MDEIISNFHYPYVVKDEDAANELMTNGDRMPASSDNSAIVTVPDNKVTAGNACSHDIEDDATTNALRVMRAGGFGSESMANFVTTSPPMEYSPFFSEKIRETALYLLQKDKLDREKEKRAEIWGYHTKEIAEYTPYGQIAIFSENDIEIQPPDLVVVDTDVRISVITPYESNEDTDLRIYKLSYRKNGKKAEKIFKIHGPLDGKMMRKILVEAGVKISNRRKGRDDMQLVADLLLRNADNVLVPLDRGWNKVGENIVFVKETDIFYKKIVEVAYRV